MICEIGEAMSYELREVESPVNLWQSNNAKWGFCQVNYFVIINLTQESIILFIRDSGLKW